jgi:hypothetical protein
MMDGSVCTTDHEYQLEGAKDEDAGDDWLAESLAVLLPQKATTPQLFTRLVLDIHSLHLVLASGGSAGEPFVDPSYIDPSLYLPGHYHNTPSSSVPPAATLYEKLDAACTAGGKRKQQRQSGSRGKGMADSTLVDSVLDAFEGSMVRVSFGPVCGHTEEEEGVVPVRFVDAFLGPVDTCAHSCIHRTSF